MKLDELPPDLAAWLRLFGPFAEDLAAMLRPAPEGPLYLTFTMPLPALTPPANEESDVRRDDEGLNNPV